MADRNLTFQADLPEGVIRKMQSMADAGWFRSTDELVLVLKSRSNEILIEYYYCHTANPVPGSTRPRSRKPEPDGSTRFFQRDPLS